MSPSQCIAPSTGSHILPREASAAKGREAGLSSGRLFSCVKWMQHPEAANFDIVVGYFGRKTAFNCTVCVRQARTRGSNTHVTGEPILVDLTWTDFWDEILASGYEYILASGYEYVWLADDDLVMDTCALNTFFDYMKQTFFDYMKQVGSSREQYDLILAQPSVCNSTDEVPSASAMPYIHQKAEFLLRYLTVVEIMGPAMRMDYFHNVFRHLINASHLGWGLDWIMPAQLLYPRDKIAVVDAVCMVHPPRCMGGGHLHPKHIDPKLLECKRAGSAYRARGVPRDPLVEENALFRAYNYTRVTTLELGYEYRDEGYWLGSIPNPRFRPPGANKPLLTPRDPGEGGHPPPFGCSSHHLQAAAEGRHLRRQQLQEEGSGGGASSSGAGFGAVIGACGWLPATALVVLLPLAALLTLGRVRKGAGGRAPPGLPGLLRKLRPTASNGHAVL
ncbi:hypothetical protein N2152v2_000881 [Parachlorella kessleri]